MDKTLRISKKYSLKRLQEEGFDITIDQWVILLRIHEEEQQTQVQLAKAVYKDTASVTRILDLLHGKKLVRRIPNEQDRRKSALTLTEKGKSYVKNAKKVVLSIREEGTQGIAAKDLEIAKNVLKKMAENMA